MRRRKRRDARRENAFIHETEIRVMHGASGLVAYLEAQEPRNKRAHREWKKKVHAARTEWAEELATKSLARTANSRYDALTADFASLELATVALMADMSDAVVLDSVGVPQHARWATWAKPDVEQIRNSLKKWKR